VLGTIVEGGHVGEPPLLLGVPYFATTGAVRESRVLAFSAAASSTRCLSFLVLPVPCHEASQRVKNAEALLGQRQKLSALGTLAAGLAHELDNPAAVARRAAEHLHVALEELPLRTAVLSERIGADQFKVLLGVQQEILKSNTRCIVLDPLAQGDLEESLEGWLADHDIAYEVGAALRLATAGVDGQERDALAE
jgi:hypothetical protein